MNIDNDGDREHSVVSSNADGTETVPQTN